MCVDFSQMQSKEIQMKLSLFNEKKNTTIKYILQRRMKIYACIILFDMHMKMIPSSLELYACASIEWRN